MEKTTFAMLKTTLHFFLILTCIGMFHGDFFYLNQNPKKASLQSFSIMGYLNDGLCSK